MSDVNKAFDLGSRVARSTIAVIDTIVQRGGFKGEELSTVGQLRDQAVMMVQMAEAHAAATPAEEVKEDKKKK